MKNILVCGASFAGLSTAYWMKRLGYNVTVVEIAPGLKNGGTPVNIEESTVDVMRRMGLLDQIRSNAISMQAIEFKDADDVTQRAGFMVDDDGYGRDGGEEDGCEEERYEIERDVLLGLLFEAAKEDVEFRFGESIASLKQERDGVDVVFKSGQRRNFDLVFGCDGLHSTVRKHCFGEEAQFSRFLGAYFSITIVPRLLIRENTTQMYNEPGKAVMLNAYNGKTDICLCFLAEQEIPYDYRNEQQQREIIAHQFGEVGWRTPKLLEEVRNSTTFYFDKLCQMKMPSWTKGRVALVGDAGYCASPAAGKGGSLAIDGAAALAEAFGKCQGEFEPAFAEYERSFRPFIEQVQRQVVEHGLEFLIPETAEAIRERNAHPSFP